MQAYKKLLNYCNTHKIEMKDSFYERFLHETTYDTHHADIAEIQVKIKE